jgi:hypothetical protein
MLGRWGGRLLLALLIAGEMAAVVWAFGIVAKLRGVDGNAELMPALLFILCALAYPFVSRFTSIPLRLLPIGARPFKLDGIKTVDVKRSFGKNIP